jgi:GGDEF domain-containing protein
MADLPQIDMPGQDDEVVTPAFPAAALASHETAAPPPAPAAPAVPVVEDALPEGLIAEDAEEPLPEGLIAEEEEPAAAPRSALVVEDERPALDLEAAEKYVQSEDDQQRNADLLRFMAKHRGDRSPEEVGRAARISAATNHPTEWVLENLAEIEKEWGAQQIDWEGIARKRPAIANYVLEDPAKLPLILGDIGPLSVISDQMRGWEHIPEQSWEGLKRGVLSTYVGYVGTLQANRQATPEQVARADRFERLLKQSSQAKPEMGFVAGIPSAFAEAVPQQVSAALLSGERVSQGAALGAGVGMVTALGTGGLGLPVIVPSTLAGAGAGLTVGRVENMGNMEKGLAFREYILLPGVTHDMADVASTFVGLPNSVLEVVPFDYALKIPLLKKLLAGKQAKDFFRRALMSPTGRAAVARAAAHLAGGMTAEGVTGALQQLNQILGGQYAQGGLENVSLGKVTDKQWDEVVESGLAEAQGGAGMAVVGSLASQVLEDRAVDKARAEWVLRKQAATRAMARESADRLSAMVNAAQASKFLLTSPEEAAKLVVAMKRAAGVAPDEQIDNVYATLEEFQRHYQEAKLDPREEAAKLMGDGGKGYDEAVAQKKEHLPIPVESFVTKMAVENNGKHAVALLEHLTLKESVETPAKSEARRVRNEKRVKELQALAPEKMEEGQRQVFEEFRRQAVESGEELAVAEANAHVYSAQLQNLAEDAGRGETAWDIWQIHPLNMEGPASQKNREREHLKDAFQEYDTHPAGRAWGVVRGKVSAPEQAAAGPDLSALEAAQKAAWEAVQAGKDAELENVEQIPAAQKSLDDIARGLETKVKHLRQQLEGHPDAPALDMDDAAMVAKVRESLAEAEATATSARADAERLRAEPAHPRGGELEGYKAKRAALLEADGAARAALRKARQEAKAAPAAPARALTPVEQLVQRERERAIAQGKGEVPAPIRKKLETVRAKIAKLEAGRATDAQLEAQVASGALSPEQAKKARKELAKRAQKTAAEGRGSSVTRTVRYAEGDLGDGTTALMPLGEGEAAPEGSTERSASLPEWLSPDSFADERAAWEWTWSALKAGQKAPEGVQRLVFAEMKEGLKHGGDTAAVQGYLLARLVEGHGGRKFDSLRTAIDEWMKLPEGARPASPIPDRAWQALHATVRYDRSVQTDQRGYVVKKLKKDAVGKWLEDTRAELDPKRATYAERPPAWFRAEEAKPAAADKRAGRVAQLREEEARLVEEGKQAALASVKTRVKLDRAAVVAIAGKDAEQLFKGALEDGGIHPDDLARAVGMESGTELVKAMLDRSDRSQWARTQAAQRALSGASQRMFDPGRDAPEASRFLTEQHESASPEERARAFYLDPNTGLLNEAAWNALPFDPERPLVAQLSVEGVKWVNDAPGDGHGQGNRLYRMVARALHGLVPDAAKVGGDFAIRVASGEELEFLLAALNDALPVKGFTVTGATGADLDHARAAHIALKQDLEAKGERALRGEQPRGIAVLEPENVAFPEELPVRAALPAPLLAKHRKLSLREQFNRAYVEADTGVLTAAAWAAIPRKQHVASIDLDGLRAMNAELGDRGGDEVLKTFAIVAREHGGAVFDFAHLHGDEFAAQGNDPLALNAFLERLAEVAREARVTLRAPDGTLREVVGLAFGRGVGRTNAEAETALRADKNARAARGERGPDADGQRVRTLSEVDAREALARGADALGGGRKPLSWGAGAQGYAGREGGAGEGPLGSRRVAAQIQFEQAGRVEPFRGMSREEFLGKPKITKAANAKDLRPTGGKSLEGVALEPFLGGKYQARFSEQGAGVYEGEDLIASYSFGDTLVVDRKHRREGIGEELVYQWRTRYPGPAKATTRTKVSQHIQEKVWARIQRELAETTRLYRDDWRGSHRPSGAENGAPLSDLTGEGRIYPDDVYGPDGERIYGTYSPLDREAFAIARRVRGDPDAKVKVYRAVPASAKDAQIRPGDWVAITRGYAEEHGARWDEGATILEAEVRAGDIFTSGDSIQEWGYSPLDEDGVTRLFQEDLSPGPIWWSPVEQAAANAKQEKGTSDSWLAVLSKSPGVKTEEVEITGLKSWLAEVKASVGMGGQRQRLEALGIADTTKGIVTREEVANYLREHRLELKETILGEAALLDEQGQKIRQHYVDLLAALKVDARIDEDEGTEFLVHDSDGDVEEMGPHVARGLLDAFDRGTLKESESRFTRAQLEGVVHLGETLIHLDNPHANAEMLLVDGVPVGDPSSPRALAARDLFLSARTENPLENARERIADMALQMRIDGGLVPRYEAVEGPDGGWWVQDNRKRNIRTGKPTLIGGSRGLVYGEVGAKPFADEHLARREATNESEDYLNRSGRASERAETAALGEKYEAALKELDGLADAKLTLWERKAAANNPEYGSYTVGGHKEGSYRELLLYAPSEEARKGYRSGHFGDHGQGLLAHARISEHMDGEGKRVMLVEEIQSDFHQKGREDGYRDEQARAAAGERMRAAHRRLVEIEGRAFVSGEPGLSEKIVEHQREVEKAREERRIAAAEADKFKKAVPDAPWKEGWEDLVVKRVLRYAADRGFERVALTPGEVHTRRWGSELIAWEKVPAEQRAEAGKPIVKAQIGPRQLREKLAERLESKQIDAAAGRHSLLTEAAYRNRARALRGAHGEGDIEAAIREAATGADATSSRAAHRGTLGEAVAALGERAGIKVDDLLDHDATPEGAIRVSLKEQHGGDVAGMNLEEAAIARGLVKNGKPLLVASEEELREALKNEMTRWKAERVAATAKKLWARMQSEEAGAFAPRKEGFAQAYDKRIRSALEKLAKRYGGKALGVGAVGVAPADPLAQVAYGEKPGGTPVYEVELPEAARDRILAEGMPLFQADRVRGELTLTQPPGDGKGPRGYIEFRPPEPGQPVQIDMKLLRSDKSTVAHESFHALSLILGQIATRQDATPAIKARYQALLDVMGIRSHEERLSFAAEANALGLRAQAFAAGKGPDLTDAERARFKFLRAREERGSHLWEAYLLEGKAPTPELRPTFARFKRWLTPLYKGLRGIGRQFKAHYGEELELSDDVRDLFDRLLASEEAVKRARAAAQPKPPPELGEATPEESAQWQAFDQEERDEAERDWLEAAATEEKTELRQQAKEEGARLRAKVERVLVEDDAGYRALLFLQQGRILGVPKLPASFLDEKGRPLKVNRAKLLERLGPEAVAGLPKGILAHGKGGIPLDDLAVKLGFGSGQELLDAIAGKDFAGAVEEGVQRLLAARFGPALLDDPDKAEGVAREALASEAGAKKMLLRLALIARHLDPATQRRIRGMSVDAIRELAVEQLFDKPLGKQSAAVYQNRSWAAQERANQLFMEGKFEAALDAVEAALWAHVYAEEAKRIREEVDAAQNTLRASNSETWRAALGKATAWLGPDGQPEPGTLRGAFRDAHDTILAGLKLAPGRSSTQRVGAQAIEAALLQMFNDAHPGVEVEEVLDEQGQPTGETYLVSANWDSEWVKQFVNSPLDWTELTPAQALTLRDAVRNIRKAANLRNEVAMGDRAVIRAQQIEELRERAERALPEVPKEPRSRLAGSLKRWRSIRLVGQWADSELRAMETWIDMLDGKREGSDRMFHRDIDREGPWHRYIWNPYLEARDRKDALAKRFLTPFIKAYEALPADVKKRAYEEVYVGDLAPLSAELIRLGHFGETDVILRSDLWVMLLNMGAAGPKGNKTRLLGGYAWEEAKIWELLKRELSEAEFDWAQSIWDALEGMYPLIAELHERETGVVPEKIVNAPFTVEFTDPVTGEVRTRQYRGGYLPAKYDPRTGKKLLGMKQEEEALKNYIAPQTRVASVVTSHAKARVSNFTDVVLLDWSVLPAHLGQVLHDLAFRSYVKQTAVLFMQPEFSAILKARLGEERALVFKPWIGAVATQQADAVPIGSATGQRLLSGLRNANAVQALGYSFVWLNDMTNPLVPMTHGTTSMKGTAKAAALHASYWPQVVANLAKQGVVSPTHLSYALAKSSTHWAEVRAWAYENIPELRHRHEGMAKHIRMILGDMAGRSGAESKLRRKIVEGAFWFQEQMDKKTATPIALARYWDARAQFKGEGFSDEEAHAKAVLEAGAAIRDNLPAVDLAEMAPLLRNRQGWGTLVMFFGYMAKVGDIRRKVIHSAYLDMKDPEVSGTGKTVTTFKAGLTLLAGALSFRVLAAYLSGHGPEEDETGGQWLMRMLLFADLSTAPLIGPSLEGIVTGKPIPTRAAPGLAVAQEAIGELGAMVEASWAVAAGEEEIDSGEAALALAEIVGGYAARAPVRQVHKTGGYLADWARGYETPRGPGDVAAGVIWGKRQGDGKSHNPATDLQDLFSE